ncbi:hypothetical protein [Bacillus cereus]|uniref:hypothetical protein n=1 Tax=Bacillus cereus TaxID=1396 RepID=UPI00240697DE|nr:hypothetical protein [Bacillus cereus]
MDNHVKIGGDQIEILKMEWQLLQIDSIQEVSASLYIDYKEESAMCAYYVESKKLSYKEL